MLLTDFKTKSRKNIRLFEYGKRYSNIYLMASLVPLNLVQFDHVNRSGQEVQLYSRETARCAVAFQCCTLYL